MLTVIQLVKKYPNLSQALAITTPPAVGWELEFTPQAGGFPEPSEDGAAGGWFGRGRVSWAEGLEGSRGTREGGPLQRRESSEETLGHRSSSPSSGVSRTAEKGMVPDAGSQTCFPHGKQTSTGVWHTRCPVRSPCGCHCAWGAPSVLIQEPNEIFLGLEDAGPTPR